MTVHIALDAIPGQDIAAVGEVAGLSPSAQGLVAAGFTAAKGYTGARVVTVDETDSSVWDDGVEPGWYYVVATGAVQQGRPLTLPQQVARDIARFQEAVERETLEWERVVAEENFQPHTDSGHAWSGDLLHALIKPNIRLQFLRLEAAKGSPTAENIAAYTAPSDHLSLAAFIAGADYGVLNIYRNALKSVWRPLRAGGSAYGYDATTGNIRVVDSSPVQAPVAYPTGTTVVTYDALSAVRSL